MNTEYSKAKMKDISLRMRVPLREVEAICNTVPAYIRHRIDSSEISRCRYNNVNIFRLGNFHVPNRVVAIAYRKNRCYYNSTLVPPIKIGTEVEVVRVNEREDVYVGIGKVIGHTAVMYKSFNYKITTNTLNVVEVNGEEVTGEDYNFYPVNKDGERVSYGFTCI